MQAPGLTHDAAVIKKAREFRASPERGTLCPARRARWHPASTEVPEVLLSPCTPHFRPLGDFCFLVQLLHPSGLRQVGGDPNLSSSWLLLVTRSVSPWIQASISAGQGAKWRWRQQQGL